MEGKHKTFLSWPPFTTRSQYFPPRSWTNKRRNLKFWFADGKQTGLLLERYLESQWLATCDHDSSDYSDNKFEYFRKRTFLKNILFASTTKLRTSVMRDGISSSFLVYVGCDSADGRKALDIPFSVWCRPGECLERRIPYTQKNLLKSLTMRPFEWFMWYQGFNGSHQ